MKVPDWRHLGLREAVLAEAVEQDNRLVLWVPGLGERRFQHWERIGTVPRAAITVERGLCVAPTTASTGRRLWGRGRGQVHRVPVELRRQGSVP